MKIWFKNENHITWLNNKPFVTSPDLISLMDLNGNPITNNALTKDLKVYIIGFRAHNIFRTEKGLEVLGPKHFGFDIEYTPIENVIEKVKKPQTLILFSIQYKILMFQQGILNLHSLQRESYISTAI
jgi:hypothetical protein